jgi:hypothetical protein
MKNTELLDNLQQLHDGKPVEENDSGDMMPPEYDYDPYNPYDMAE